MIKDYPALTNAFLNDYGLTMKEVKEKYQYAGNDKDRNTNGKKTRYEVLFGKDAKYPTHVDNCICGQRIKNNCFITTHEKDHIITLGNCCIRRFEGRVKKCDICKKIHRNRKDNICNDCRKQKENAKICIICNKKEKFIKNIQDNKCRECMDLNSDTIITFGKYINKPISTLMRDKYYCNWVSECDYLKTTNPRLQQYIINLKNK